MVEPYVNNYQWECREAYDDSGDIVCDADNREVRLGGGRVSSVNLEDGDIEVESDGRGNVSLTGGRQTDEVLEENLKVSRRFSNREMMKESQ